MRKFLPILILSTLFVSCAQEVLEPEQQISGLFALYDESWLVSDYVSFENGRWSQYSTMGTLYPLAEGKIWHTNGGRFRLMGKQNYSIRDGVFTTSGGVSGPIELKDGVLTIGSKRYVALEGFEEAPYSRIVAQNEYVFTYTDQDISIPFTVENPLPYQELTAGLQSYASGGTWITNLAVQEGKITAHLSATAEDRTGTIELSYTHAESVTVQIKQQPSTFITIPETSRTVDYTSSTQTLNYSIENPVATSTLRAYPSDSWVHNINISENQISFDVQENNSGADRNATLTLRYEGARDVTFNVLQRWSASSITLTPASKEVDYTGGSFNFNYAITNPREGVSITASSQVNWITDVQVTGTTISYKVAENNSGAQRTGKIKLTYGSYATAEFSVTQSWTASSITMTPSSQTMNYTSGSFNFSYTITNPRTNTTITVASQDSWITNVTVSGNIISYKVAENNTGAQRTGKIKLTYGSYATAEFTVTQSWAASSITMTPSSQTIDYAGGSFNLSYTITNPRANTTVTAVSQVNWITDVAILGNSISYKVAENNSGAQRTGKIKLTYGTYATTEFTLTQLGSPAMSLSLNKSELALLTGASETLVATVNPTDAVLQWSSNMTSVATVNQNGEVTAMGNGIATISVASGEKIAQCMVTVTTAVKGVGLNKTTLKLNPGESETLVATISPSTASNQSLIWTSGNISAVTVDPYGKVDAIADGYALITVTTVDGEYTATCTVLVFEDIIDLGLPSGLKWASCNLGASNPADKGDYYAWGETETKSDYSWSTYKFGTSSSGPFSKYNTKSSYGTVDNRSKLTLGDDAAHVKLGGSWRMPTSAEWYELMTKCTWTWTNNFNGTKVKGIIVTATNGKSIFLPAAGDRNHTSHYYDGSRGYYWSSSLYTNDPNSALHMFFTSNDISTNNYLYRDYGLSIRPVSE